MASFFGSILRALSTVWVVFAVLRILAGLAGVSPGQNLLLGVFGLALAVATFKFGTGLKNRPKQAPMVEQVASVKSAWWGSDYGFRLAVFCGAVWSVATYFWQDSYDLDWSLVLWPPVGILMTYFGYKAFVAGAKPSDAIRTMPAFGSPEPEKSAVNPPSAEELDVAVVPSSGKDRSRAMDELIQRMRPRS